MINEEKIFMDLNEIQDKCDEGLKPRSYLLSKMTDYVCKQIAKAKKDIISARRCLVMMRGCRCDDLDCKNLSCPLNKKHLEAEDE